MQTKTKTKNKNKVNSTNSTKSQVPWRHQIWQRTPSLPRQHSSRTAGPYKDTHTHTWRRACAKSVSRAFSTLIVVKKSFYAPAALAAMMTHRSPPALSSVIRCVLSTDNGREAAAGGCCFGLRCVYHKSRGHKLPPANDTAAAGNGTQMWRALVVLNATPTPQPQPPFGHPTTKPQNWSAFFFVLQKVLAVA